MLSQRCHRKSTVQSFSRANSVVPGRESDPSEIERLCVGCVSLSHVPATTDRHSGKEHSAFDQYMLRVPVSKTMKEFVKPIESPMAEAILAWEQARPVQPPVADSTTKEMVHYLFSYRGNQVGAAVCNHVVIPLLLRKAGLPK